MPALFCNIRINEKDRYSLFQKTFTTLAKFFSEYHICIRGDYSKPAQNFINEILSERQCTFYTSKYKNNWAKNSLEMLSNIKSNSIFIYIEDHLLVNNDHNLSALMEAFEDKRIDHMQYSFFKASGIAVENILPLSPDQHEWFYSFVYTKMQAVILSNCQCDKFYTFSLPSVVSKRLLKVVLILESKRAIYSKFLTQFIFMVFGYPGNHEFRYRINKLLHRFDYNFCLYPPDSPFNLERTRNEFITNDFRYAILKKEIFANIDDDNGAYGESMIKRGMYPFDHTIDCGKIRKSAKIISSFNRSLNTGERYDLIYFPRQSRIINLPVISLIMIRGRCEFIDQLESRYLSTGDRVCFYSNIEASILAIDESYFELTMYTF